jgi:hypothetical protein
MSVLLKFLAIFPLVSALARAHKLPYQRLLARFKGRNSLKSRLSSSWKLTSIQSNALFEYILSTSDDCFVRKLPARAGMGRIWQKAICNSSLGKILD